MMIINPKIAIVMPAYNAERTLKNTLVIASDWELPLRDTDKGKVVNIDPAKILKMFYHYNGEPAFYAIKL